MSSTPHSMTKGNPLALITAFAVPLLIGGIFQQVYSLVDVMIVGRYLGEQALAGVGMTNNLTVLLLSLIMGLCNGTGILVAQCFGVENYSDMRRAVTAIIWIVAILTGVVVLIGLTCVPFFLQLLRVPADASPYALTYLRIMYVFVAGSILYNSTAAILRSFGDSKTPLYALILSSVLNIVLDFLLVVIIPWGVTGAAVATIVAQHASGLFCLFHLYRHRKAFQLTGLRAFPDKAMVFQIFRLGIPTAFQGCLISLGGLSVQRLINTFGTAVMAGYTAAVKIDSIAIQVITSLGTALSVFTSQNIGTGRYDRIRTGLRGTLVLSLLSALLIASCAFFFGEPIIRLFLGENDSADTVATGVQYLSVIGVAYLICAVMQSYQNVIRGSGDVNTCMAAGMTELAGRIVFSYLLAPHMGALGIWVAVPLSWGCGCAVPVVRYYSGKWKLKAYISQS